MRTYESRRDSSPFLWLTCRRDISIIETNKISTRPMYDDYEIESFNNEFYSYDLDEIVENHMNNSLRDMQSILDSYDNDEDYERDSCDYNDLAYRHYA